ncbi:MAG: glycosyltransferase, partial [Bacteroidales bacterium]|nr:glycosyltransferase [Bacteroidales bacterium]
AMVYPSLYEGFGFPVTEAMACGARCLVAKNSSLTEVGGEAALYFNENDEDELCNRMVEVAESASLRDEMKQRSLSQADKFNWEKYAAEFVDILENNF